MEIHDRFMKSTTTGINVLESLTGNRDTKSSILQDFVVTCNKKILEDTHDLESLETLRTILCYEYQSLINSRNKDDALECKGCSYVDFTRFFITNNKCQVDKDFFVLYDIVVLQSILHSNKELLIKSFNNFCEYPELLTSPETTVLAMRVSECFADSCALHSYLYKSTVDATGLVEQSDRILMIILQWLNRGEDTNWKLLASLLPKLVVAFNPEKIIPPLWNRVIGSCSEGIASLESIYLDEKLTALCVMADVCFPSETESIREFHYEQCVKKEFWSWLEIGILSTISQQRKQALYLIKRAMEFFDSLASQSQNQKTLDGSAMPFIHDPLQGREFALEEMKKTFFLILEALEEKQKHLVLPTLSHLSCLVKTLDSNESCFTHFNPTWLRCVFLRILQHDNDSVKLFGLQEIFKCPSRLFDDPMFRLRVIDVLNNNSLYEIDVEERKPKIVDQLEECIVRWEEDGTTLINTFFQEITAITWSPVPIYWVLVTLLGVTGRCRVVVNRWRSEELRSLNKLIKESINIHPLPMRSYSHALIIHNLNCYTAMPADPKDFDCIFDIISTFTSGDCSSQALYVPPIHWSTLIKPSDAHEYVALICKKKLEMDQSLRSFANTIDLMRRNKLIMIKDSCPTIKALKDLLINLSDANARPYADHDFILKVVKLTSHLIDRLCHPYEGQTELSRLVLPYRREIMEIVGNSLRKNTIQPYKDYLFAIECVIGSKNIPTLNNLKKELKEFEEKFIRVIENPHDFSQTQWMYAIEMWNVFVDTRARENVHLHKDGNIDNDGDSHERTAKICVPSLIKYFLNEVMGNGREDDIARRNNGGRGKFVSDCSKTVANLLRIFLIRHDVRWPNELWFQGLMALVETDDDRVISNVSKILLNLLGKTSSLTGKDLENIDVMIKISWRTVLRLKKTSNFSSAMSSMIRVIVHDQFLELDGATEYATECIEEMIQDEGEYRKFSSKKSLLSAMKLLKPENKLLFYKAFAFCLIHDAAPRRDGRTLLATTYHCRHFDKDIDPVYDCNTRGYAVEYLTHVIHLPECAQIREKLLDEMLEILEKNKNKRYFDNSDLHMLKNRVMQALLTIVGSLDNAQSQRLYDALCDLLISESNQPSVRLMHEWLLVKLCLSGAVRQEDLWMHFQTAAEKRPGSIVSLASVVFHLAQRYSGETRIEFIAKAIPRLLPNCMGQQFNVRLYSQTILVRIYEMLPKDSPQAAIYRDIYVGVEESLRRGNLMKNSSRVFDNFYFKIFDPVLDYNAETIYHDLPRLTNVSANEWLSRSICKTLTKIHSSESNLVESRDVISMAKPLAQSSRPTGDLAESAETFVGNGPSDIQKKVIPWKTMIPFHDDLSEISKANLRQRTLKNEDGGIIVVASLIDRPPNLGGIARTCEIMGAKELIIGSLRYVEDREFQTLSVSAEKWITITEVKPHLLRNYLLEKASEGWKLVGAEQTANSMNLLETEFSKKTVLVLGNERDGIPANLIPLLDSCVEIPQNGVVRSLNVHVTGAICLWQYAKRHVFDVNESNL